MASNDELVVIFEAESIGAADLVKVRLELGGVAAFIDNESTGTLAPWLLAPGGAGKIRVIVAAEDREKAERILAESPSEPDET